MIHSTLFGTLRIGWCPRTIEINLSSLVLNAQSAFEIILAEKDFLVSLARELHILRLFRQLLILDVASRSPGDLSSKHNEYLYGREDEDEDEA